RLEAHLGFVEPQRRPRRDTVAAGGADEVPDHRHVGVEDLRQRRGVAVDRQRTFRTARARGAGWDLDTGCRRSGWLTGGRRRRHGGGGRLRAGRLERGHFLLQGLELLLQLLDLRLQRGLRILRRRRGRRLREGRRRDRQRGGEEQA